MRPTGSSLATLLAALAIAVALPEPASAHLVNTRFGNFYDGMLHPLTALEHMVPWLALGMLVGSEPKTGRLALIAFPVGLGLGVAIGCAQPELAFLTTANIVSILVLGALVALTLPLAPFAVGAVAFVIGVSHGYSNGAAMTEAVNPALFAPGVVVAGYITVLIVAAITAILTQRWRAARVGVRALGSWIFAIGVMMLGASVL
ncbi:hypothetical protein T281_16830 [Rhodomicrobium udaipurense JA643]|nr:hypothetical protein T281_16830 [Rhodomicrobium udaipurense JA643]